MQADAPKLAAGSIASAGAWLWSRAAGGFVTVTAARFELRAIAETDPQLHALARGERVEVAALTFLLWAPDYLPAERNRHRGPVAAALDAATNNRTQELSLDGNVFLCTSDTDSLAWLRGHRSGHAVWFTCGGASLHVLRGVDVAGDELLVVDLERIVG